MSDIVITEEDQLAYIDGMAMLMDTFNQQLPSIAGNGDLDAALQIFQIECAKANLHLQRTFVLASVIRDHLTNIDSEFKKAGGDFVGPSTPTN